MALSDGPPPSLQAQLDGLTSLHREFSSFLERVEKGRPPCHTPSCQLQKMALLEELSHHLARLPRSTSPFVADFDRAIFSGYRLASSAPPHVLDRSDQWREQRFHVSHHINWRSSWYTLISDLYLIQDLIRVFTEVQADPQRKLELKRLIGRGLLEVAFHMDRGQKALSGVTEAFMEHNSERLQETRARSEAHYDKFHKLSEQVFGEADEFSVLTGSPHQPPLFPSLNPAQQLQMLLHLREWSRLAGPNELFDAPRNRFLSRAYDSLEKAIDSLQAFNDLEFGVLGLENMQSIANPLLRNQADQQLHSRLYQEEEINAFTASVGTFMFDFFILKAWVGPSFLRTLTAFSAFQFWSIQQHPLRLGGGNKLMQLKLESYDLYDQVLRRQEVLEKARNQIQKRLAQIEREIAFIEQSLEVPTHRNSSDGGRTR